MQPRFFTLLLSSTFIYFSAQAQETIIYQEDFENPGPYIFQSDPSPIPFPAACNKLTGSGAGNFGWDGAAPAYNTLGTPFYQRNTADVVCIDAPAPLQNDVTDPAVKGGQYAIGFHGGNQYSRPNDAPNSAESIGYIFDPQGQRVLKGSFDASLLGIPGRTANEFSFPQNVPVNFQVNFYEVPASVDPVTISINAAVTYGDVMHPSFGGITQTPLSSQSNSISNSNTQANRFTLDWKSIPFYVDLRNIAAGSRLMMVLTGLPSGRYLVLDNMRILASPNAVTVPAGNVIVPPGTLGIFDTKIDTTALHDLPVVVQNTFTPIPASTGTLTESNGIFTFTPAPGFTGSVTVTYTGCDSAVAPAIPVCASNTITFTVPAPPAAGNVTAVPVGGPAATLGLGLLMVVGARWRLRRAHTV